MFRGFGYGKSDDGFGGVGDGVEREEEHGTGVAAMAQVAQGMGGNAARAGWGLRGMVDNPLERASASRREDAMDDEEALKWAAVERLPTYDRVRTSIFHDASTGRMKQVDVRELTPLETTELLDKLMAEAQDENNVFLQKMRKRLDKYETYLNPRSPISKPTAPETYSTRVSHEIFTNILRVP